MPDDATVAISKLTATIVTRYAANKPHVPTAELSSVIRSVRAALAEIDPPPPNAAGAASRRAERRRVDRSITAEALISFIDNKPYKTLERHLRRHGLDMAGYRERYRLPSEYPSAAPNYEAAKPAAMPVGKRNLTR